MALEGRIEVLGTKVATGLPVIANKYNRFSGVLLRPAL